MKTLKCLQAASFAALAVLCRSYVSADTVTTPLRVFGYPPLVKMAVAPDGQHFVTAGGDNGGLAALQIWDVASGKVILRFAQESIAWTTAWYGLSYSPDGKLIAASSPSTTSAIMVRVWDANTGDLRQTLNAPINFHITGGSTTFSPDGTQLAQGGNGFVRIWDLVTGKVLRDLGGVSGTRLQASFSPNGARMFATGDDSSRSAGLWEVNTGRLLWTLNGQVYGDSTFTADGKNVLLHFTVQDTTRVRLLNAADGTLVREFANPVEHSRSVAMSPDGQRVVSAGWRGGPGADYESSPGFVRLWDAQTGQSLLSLEGHVRDVFQVAFLPDNTRLLTASVDQTVRLWDAKTGALLRSYEGHMAGVESLAWLPDGRSLVTASDHDAVRVWDAQTGDFLRTVVHSGRSVALSPSGNLAAFNRPSGDIEFWDIAKGSLRATYATEEGTSRVLVFSPDGKSFAIGDGRVVEAPLGLVGSNGETVVGPQPGSFASRNPFPVYLATFSWDGRQLFAAGKIETLPVTQTYYSAALLWKLDVGWNWPPQQVFDGLFDIVDAAAFSPDGTRLALSSHSSVPPWGAKVRVVDLKTREETVTLNDIRGPIAFSPEGKWLLTCQFDFPTAKLWDAQSGRLLREFGSADPSRGFSSVAFSPDGCQVLMGSHGSATLWDLRDLRANLRVGLEDGRPMVRWDAGELQSASAVNGLWTTIQGATSPYALAASAPANLFRVRGAGSAARE